MKLFIFKLISALETCDFFFIFNLMSVNALPHQVLVYYFKIYYIIYYIKLYYIRIIPL